MKFEWNAEYIETILSFFRDGSQQGKYIFTIEDQRADKHDEPRELKIMNFLKGTKMKVQLFKTSLHYVNANFGTLLFSISQNMVSTKNRVIADLEAQVDSQREQIMALEDQIAALKKQTTEGDLITNSSLQDNDAPKRQYRTRLRVKHKSTIDDSQNEEDIEVCFKQLKKIRQA